MRKDPRDVQLELDALHKKIADLMAGLEAAKAQADEGDSVKRLTRHLQEDLAKSEDKVANLGVLRSVVLINKNGGNSTGSAEIVYGSGGRLPSAEGFIAYVTALASEPLALRALHHLILGHFEGKPLQETKAALATSLQVGEAEIERAMLPLVDNNTVRWSKNARGEEYYVLNDTSIIVLLSCIGEKAE